MLGFLAKKALEISAPSTPLASTTSSPPHQRQAGSENAAAFGLIHGKVGVIELADGHVISFLDNADESIIIFLENNVEYFRHCSRGGSGTNWRGCRAVCDAVMLLLRIS